MALNARPDSRKTPAVPRGPSPVTVPRMGTLPSTPSRSGRRPIPPATSVAPPRSRAGRPSPNAASPHAAGTERSGSCTPSNAVPAPSDRPSSALARKPSAPPATASPGPLSALPLQVQQQPQPASPAFAVPVCQPRRLLAACSVCPCRHPNASLLLFQTRLGVHSVHPQVAPAPLLVLLCRDLLQVADCARGQAPPAAPPAPMELDALCGTVRLAVASPRHAQRYATSAQVTPTSPRTHPTLRALR